MDYTTFPTQITAGDSWKYTYTPTDAEQATDQGWTLTVLLNGQISKTLTAIIDGDNYVIDVPTSISTTFIKGLYNYTILLSKPEKRLTLETGQIDILIDPAHTPPGDVRTIEKRTLDNIEAVIEKRASKDQMSYTIDGRSLSRTPLNELLTLRDYYKSLVMRQQNKYPKSIQFDFRNSYNTTASRIR